MKKIEIFKFDIEFIKNEIVKKINENKEIMNMNIFKKIIFQIINDDVIMYKSSNLIIKALADFEEGIIKHNVDSITLTSSYFLTYKNLFESNNSMYEYSFKIDGDKLYILYKNLIYGDKDEYDYKIEYSLNLFKNTMEKEENYTLVINEIVSNFIEKVEKTYNYIMKLMEVKTELTEEEVIKEIFLNIAEHKCYSEYNKWKKNENREK